MGRVNETLKTYFIIAVAIMVRLYSLLWGNIKMSNVVSCIIETLTGDSVVYEYNINMLIVGCLLILCGVTLLVFTKKNYK